MKKTVFTGMASAIVTPMKADLTVDYEALAILLNFRSPRASMPLLPWAPPAKVPPWSPMSRKL